MKALGTTGMRKSEKTVKRAANTESDATATHAIQPSALRRAMIRSTLDAQAAIRISSDSGATAARSRLNESSR